MAKSKENLVDEGFRVSLVETAFFDGKLKPEYAHILDEYGVQYKVFTDFQRLSRRKEVV
ncbi:hypothetical protein [Lachnospira multipara]|uniref:hypothetical protein n=1 Tax=Lachnospira multipara TaxID=28051 RepID=UPI0012DBE2B2|nr:hypothetical protein [Lachnospira multipara]